MNFSQSVREEILNKPIKDKCCKKAFIAGLIRGNGNLFYKEEGLGLDFSVKDERFVPFVSDMFSDVYSYEIREVSVREDTLNKKDVFTLSISGPRAEEILSDMEILVKNNEEYAVNLKPYGKITEKPCCLKSFFKGLYLSCGHSTVPNVNKSKKTRYHTELEFSHSATAYAAAEKLGENGVAAGIVRRKNQYVVYLKSGEEMKNFFAFLSLPVSVLKLTELMVNGEMTNMINRRKNCDIGNVVRQMDASEKQIAAIKLIEEKAGLAVLKKPDLIKTAKARLENPEDSAAELAEKLSVGKSCLNHRLRKILSVAEEMENKR